MTMIAIGADHAGCILKQALRTWLAGRGHLVTDFGTDSTDPVDYPDYAAVVAAAVADGRVDRGVLVCGSGVGMAIAANKVHGIRAVVAADAGIARLSREHNDTNVLALGARVIDEPTAHAVLDAWLGTPFAGGRHARRLEKVAALDLVRHAPVDVAAR